MYYLAWIVVIFCCFGFGKIVYGLSTCICIAPHYLFQKKQSYLGFDSVGENGYTGFCRGVFGTVMLFFMLRWSLTIIYANHPVLLKIFSYAFDLFVIKQIVWETMKIKKMESMRANGTAAERILAELSIPFDRWSKRGMIVSYIVIVIWSMAG